MEEHDRRTHDAENEPRPRWVVDPTGAGAKISYLYDFGDSWNHTITLEKSINSR